MEWNKGLNVYENVDLPSECRNLDFICWHVYRSFRADPAVVCKKGSERSMRQEQQPIYIEIMLQDGAHIQEFEAEWKNRKAKTSGKPEVVPIYTMDDAINVIRYFCAMPIWQTDWSCWRHYDQIYRYRTFVRIFQHWSMVKGSRYWKRNWYSLEISETLTSHWSKIRAIREKQIMLLWNLRMVTVIMENIRIMWQNWPMWSRGPLIRRSVDVPSFAVGRTRSCYIISVRSRLKIGSRIMEISRSCCRQPINSGSNEDL